MSSHKLIFPLLLLLAVSCGPKHFKIEDRARLQAEASLPYELTSYCPGPHSWSIEDMKTVYVNDTICLLQFSARFRDKDNNKYIKDFRYIYLLDCLESRFVGKPVYKEQFRNILCMPDELILALQKQIEESGEDVYSSSYGGVAPVVAPIDQK